MTGECDDALEETLGCAPARAQHRTQRRAEQRQRTCRIFVSQPALVLAPERITAPVVGVFDRPLTAGQAAKRAAGASWVVKLSQRSACAGWFCRPF